MAVGLSRSKVIDSEESYSWKTILAFLIVGINPSWSIPCALFTEVPIFQLSSPEGLSLAAWMNVAINVGLVFTLGYVFYDSSIQKINPETAIKFVIVVSSALCVLLAFTWTYTAHNISVTILGMSIVGGTVGTFQVLVFLPYMTRYKPPLFALQRLGDVIFVGALSLLGLAQQGLSISPTLFFLILAPTQIVPLLAIQYISKNSKDFLICSEDTILVATENARVNAKIQNTEHTPLQRSDQLMVPETSKRSKSLSESLTENSKESRRLWKCIGECSGLIFTVCCVNMHMWGSFISLLPIGTRNASPIGDQEGSMTLAYANNLGLLALVPGIVAAPNLLLGETSLFWLSVAQVALYAVVYMAIFNLPPDYWGDFKSASVLVSVFCLGRLNEALISTSAYTLIGTKYPDLAYQISSFMGICDRLSITVLTWVSFIWVTSCRS
mmetsp:Transcript_6773/g.10364  ORF Transcript_6773/g.10364 Transcript_6773/m.10364 type:complete len:440 (+) Transcript_6773:61-1380(+)